MLVNHYFPTIIGSGDIPDFFEIRKEFQDNTDAISKLMQADVFGDNVYSTNKSVRCLIKELNLLKTKDVINRLFYEYKHNIPKFKNANMVLYQSWFNITEPGGFQDMHSHAFDELAGCFYLDIPEDSGNIEFAPLVELASPHSRESFTPYSGMYVFFPGDVLHRVTYNKSSYQRISFAFNYKIKYDLV